MRSWIIFAITLTCFCNGCTHLALERRTVKQASTLTDLQHKQVLDNLAMFCCNPEAMPWHVRLKGGLVQIADQGSGAFGADIATAVGGEVTRLLPAASAQRGIVGQWDVDPVVDDDDLELLQLAYASQVQRDPKKLEELQKDIRLKIWKLVLTYEFAPGSKFLLDLTNDGLEAGFEHLTKELSKVEKAEPAAAKSIGEARKSVEEARENLERAIEWQRFEMKKKDRSENHEKVQNLLASFEENLKKASETNLKTAIEILSPIKASENNVKTLKHIKSKIDYMADREEKQHEKENLRLIIAHLNPVISRDLEARRKAEEKDSYQPRFHGPFSGPFEPQFNFFSYVGAADYLFPQGRGKVQDRNPGLADQAKNKVVTLRELLHEPKPWFCCGAKKDVPKCACYVGHYCKCGKECYVWVMPDQMKELREFTLKVLSLAASERQDLTVLGRGAAFSPGR